MFLYFSRYSKNFSSGGFFFYFKETEMEHYRVDAAREAKLQSEVEVLKMENQRIKQELMSLQSELFGTKLAARYLDKELAGRLLHIICSFQ